MRKLPSLTLGLVLSTLCAGPAAAQTSSSGKLPDAPAAKTQTSNSTAPFKDQKERVSYAVGMFLASRIRPQAAEFDSGVVAQGLKDGLSGKPLMTEEESMATLAQWQKDIQAKEVEKRKLAGEASQKAGDEFLAANKTKEGVVTLPSGLQYKILVPGTGPKPAASDTVVINYKGTLIDGTEFDSSSKHGGPMTHPVNEFIKGWTEALQLMPVGSKWQLFVPANLAYGERGAGSDIGPNATLIFEVELLSIKPKDVPAPDKEIPPAK